MIAKVNIGDLIEVSWEDHYNSVLHIGWQDVDELKTIKPMMISSVGYVVGQDSKRLAISPTFSEDVESRSQQFCGGHSIRLKADIRNIKIIRKHKSGIKK